MLAIRLARIGRKNVKVFRIVVSEKTKHPKRGSLAILGLYNPEKNPALFDFDQKKAEEFISKGAQPSETVARLLGQAGLKGMDKFYDAKKVYKKKNKSAPAEAAAPAAAPAA